MSENALKGVLCDMRNTFASFLVDGLPFGGKRSNSDLSCNVFLQIALSGLREVVTPCKLRGRRGTSV